MSNHLELAHRYDTTVAIGAGLPQVARSVAFEEEEEEDSRIEINIDTFGTFGSAGTLGGTAGSLGTMGCCC